jgi:hypothetical protein
LIDLQRLSEQAQRLLIPAALRLEHPQKMQGIELIFVVGENLIVEKLGLAKISGLVCGDGPAQRVVGGRKWRFGHPLDQLPRGTD